MPSDDEKRRIIIDRADRMLQQSQVLRKVADELLQESKDLRSTARDIKRKKPAPRRARR